MTGKRHRRNEDRDGDADADGRYLHTPYLIWNRYLMVPKHVHMVPPHIWSDGSPYLIWNRYRMVPCHMYVWSPPHMYDMIFSGQLRKCPLRVLKKYLRMIIKDASRTWNCGFSALKWKFVHLSKVGTSSCHLATKIIYPKCSTGGNVISLMWNNTYSMLECCLLHTV